MTPTFALQKEWQDAEAGIELVQIRYVCSPPDGSPVWSLEESRVLVPRGTGQLLRRSCPIELPCGLTDAVSYDLHYYFLVIKQGRQLTLLPARDRIASGQVAYNDKEGAASAAAVQWVIGETGPPNYTPLQADALVSAANGPRARVRAPGTGRIFKGLVWGPAGSTVNYTLRVEMRVSKDIDHLITRRPRDVPARQCGQVALR